MNNKNISRRPINRNFDYRGAAGSSDIRRDGLQKDGSITLYDIDYAVKYHLEQVITPKVEEAGTQIVVPVMFAYGDTFNQIQKRGHIRDNNKKLLTPLITIRRTGLSKRPDMIDLNVLESAEARIILERSYSSRNRYDRNNLTGKPVQKEYYSLDVPKFVQLDYELMVWTSNTVQLNAIIEQLLWFDGKAFGDQNKFITYIDDPSFETSKEIGEDRYVRATIPLRTKAYILHTSSPEAPSMYKLNPVNTIIITQETDTAMNDYAPSKNVKTNVASPGIRSGSLPSKISPAMLYLNTNKQLTGAVISSDTCRFISGWEVAPTELPATSIDNFTFFINGVYIPRTAIISFTVTDNVSTLIFDTDILGYTLDASDIVVGIGKFINQDQLA